LPHNCVVHLAGRQPACVVRLVLRQKSSQFLQRLAPVISITRKKALILRAACGIVIFRKYGAEALRNRRADMVFDKLRELAADQFGVDADEITMDTNFVDDFDADSIDVVEFMMAVEEAFELGEIEENALERIKTLGDVAAYIADHT
jgi:acyl carrier protein